MTALPRNLLSLPQVDLERALASRAHQSWCQVFKAGARRLLAQPKRIERALYPDLYGPVPVSIADRLQRCEARIDCERQLGRAGHFAYSPDRLVDLRQARIALRYQRRFTRIEVVPIDEVENFAPDISWRISA
ncbi:hypothetical protein OSH11_11890 [Kaistia dalseonensis]|uniref:Uncharacterized protein n=1 Tax=Kaistia dalseonensis TaxID=410840 RepID=A0ABU0H6T9_9HYPH|nr:hypothetical protein [Kaistia dalseonensis]MCX5495410.1 hypothetical protein [Kaistia dalseonensis]MDQ0438000.1 hypothetical protein [Kaistia dalseonensis]